MSNVRFKIAAPVEAVHRALLVELESARSDLRSGSPRINGRIDRHGFRIWVERAVVAGEMDPLQLRGTIRAAGNVTYVSGSVSSEHALWVAPVLLIGVAAVVWATGGRGAGLMIFFAVLLLFTSIIRGMSPAADSDAKYLVDWLTRVLDGIERRASLE